MDFINIVEKEYQRACRIQKENPEKAQELFILLRDALDKVIADSVNAVKSEELTSATRIVSKQFPLNNN